MLSLLAALVVRQNTALVITDGLVIEGVARSGRSNFATDPVQKEVVDGSWKAPVDGEALGSAKWRKLSANKDGAIVPGNAGGSYFFASVHSPDEHVALLRARGHGMVYVNGEPRMGDPYDVGYVVLPVLVKKGGNELLFALSRGGIRAALEIPKSPHVLNLGDPTFPDVREGERGRFFGAVIVVNASTSTASGLRMSASFGDGAAVTTKLPSIPPLSVRKVRVDFEVKGDEKVGDFPLHLKLGDHGQDARGTLGQDAPATGDEGVANLRVRSRKQCYKRTFVSHIDGSVQYYGVNPATIQHSGQGLVLSLHGAGVEAIGQAEAYGAHDWCNVVCPTNRRPYGFDWEGIGREDAMEVLDDAFKNLSPDPRQIYLTGHSMGGHGAWTVGAHYPDRFAVVFPSAGWQSFYSYGGKRRAPKDDAMGQIFERASADSDTALLLDNLRMPAIYGLHGTADDNVPISEIRTMKSLLSAKGIEFAGYHEQKDAGHWWDADPAPGADCVDWKPAFEMMQRSRLARPDELAAVDFTTVDPAASSMCRWAAILQQVNPGQPSRIRATANLKTSTVTLTSENVAKFHLELPPRDGARGGNLLSQALGRGPSGWTVKLGSKSLDDELDKDYLKSGESWKQVGHTTSQIPREADKTAMFSGVFNNQVMFVYSTHGTAAENAWSFAKARFDAEQLLVRGNGAVDVVPDTEVSNSNRRNLVVYSCGSANSALRLAYGDGFDPRDRMVVKKTGPLTSLVSYPGRNRWTQIGIVQGNDLAACRLTDRLPYFVSGVGFPDWCLITSDVLVRGTKGVLGAGFLGANWGYDEGNSVWQK